MYSSFLLVKTLFTLLSFLLILTNADIPPYNNSGDYENGTYGSYPLQTYISNPDIVAPIANILTAPQDGVSPSDYILWTPVRPGFPRTGPSILDTKTLSLVYQGPAFGEETIGATIQQCNGTDYMTWWSGWGLYGRKAGNYYMFSADYTNVYNVSAVGDLHFGDAHEFFLTPNCTAVFTSYQPRKCNLTGYGIEEGWLLDSYFQEIDIATNELLFEWKASDHVNITDSFLTPNISLQGSHWNAFDFFHINSIQKDEKGNYLVSSRHMESLYYIDGITGVIHWTLGGRQNQFTDLSGGNATNFAWQHHARWTSPEQTSISLYDNRNSVYKKAVDPVSRGIIISLDYMNMSVTLNASYSATLNISSIREGSMQILPDTDGNVLLGYGNEPGFTEFAADGKVLWDVHFGPLGRDRRSADNYRALKVNWTGAPSWNPSIAAGPTVAHTQIHDLSKALPQNTNMTNDTAYFSWNGATEIVKWVILASNDTAVGLNTTGSIWTEVIKVGFESKIHIGEQTRYVRALAVNASNIIIGATPVLDMQTSSTGEEFFDPETFDLEVYTRAQGSSVDSAWKVLKKKIHHIKEHGQWKVFAASVLGGVCGLSVVALGLWTFCRRRCLAEAWNRRIGGGYSTINLAEVDGLEKLESGVVITAVEPEERSDDEFEDVSDSSFDKLEKSGLIESEK